MKRADLTTHLILSTIDYWGVHAWERFAEKYPPKLILAALQREVDAGRLTYGVALHRPFLTDEGRAALDGGQPDTPAPTRVIDKADFEGTDFDGNPVFRVVEAHWEPAVSDDMHGHKIGEEVVDGPPFPPDFGSGQARRAERRPTRGRLPAPTRSGEEER